MKRGATGRVHVTVAGGRRVRTFVPDPLPPNPPVTLDGRLQLLMMVQAVLALGRLDALSTFLRDTSLFLCMYVRKEALLSY